MSLFQCLFSSSSALLKIARNSFLAIVVLVVAGCTGDSLDGMTTNADGTTNLSPEDQAKFQPNTAFYMIELKWSPPASRAAGTPMTSSEIKYYQIRQYADDGSFIYTEVPGNTTRAGIPVLSKGTYKFSIIAVDTDGRQSDPSAMIAANVQ